MNSKISLPDLINALATNSGTPRATCERFIKTMFSIIASRLTSGENVKIKGLGTFKVSDVDERKSVNVNTGAEMVIPGHRKVTFTPDKALAETINQPFAMFEAVELDEAVTEELLASADSSESTTHVPDNVSEAPKETSETLMPDNQTTGQQFEGVPERTAEIEEDTESDKDKREGTENTISQPIHPQPVDKDYWEEAVEEQFSEPVSTSNSETDSNVKQTPAEYEAGEPENRQPESEQTPVPESTLRQHKPNPVLPPVSKQEIDTSVETEPLRNDEEEIIEVDKPEGKDKFEIHVHPGACQAPRFRKGIYIGMLIAAACLVLIMIGWRLLLPDSFCKVTGTVLPTSTIHLSQNAIEATPIDTASERLAANSLPETARIQPEPTADTEDSAPTKVSDKANTDSVKQEPKVYDTITTKRFLTTMAKEHYGSYHLWPYIYDENASRLGHPDRIRPGTKVVIPPASKYGIDASNPECIAKAKRRGAAIYARYNK